MQIVVKAKNKSVGWVEELRPRVGDHVEHNNSSWINTTGRNSEPSVGDDWFLVRQSSSGNSVSAWKQSISFIENPIPVEQGATVIFVTINGVPTFNFSQNSVNVTVDEAQENDEISFYGTK